MTLFHHHKLLSDDKINRFNQGIHIYDKYEYVTIYQLYFI